MEKFVLFNMIFDKYTAYSEFTEPLIHLFIDMVGYLILEMFDHKQNQPLKEIYINILSINTAILIMIALIQLNETNFE